MTLAKREASWRSQILQAVMGRRHLRWRSPCWVDRLLQGEFEPILGRRGPCLVRHRLLGIAARGDQDVLALLDAYQASAEVPADVPDPSR